MRRTSAMRGPSAGSGPVAGSGLRGRCPGGRARSLAGLAVALVAGACSPPPPPPLPPPGPGSPAPAPSVSDSSAAGVVASTTLDPALLVPGPPRRVGDRYLFTLVAPDARSVHLAATFNGWLPTVQPLTRHGDLWYALVEVPRGRQRYEFVIDGRVWMTDPDNPRQAGNEAGGLASVLNVR